MEYAANGSGSRKRLASYLLPPLPIASQFMRLLLCMFGLQGHPKLVNVLAEVFSKIHNRPINPLTEVLVTVGAYQSLFCAIAGMINLGDEVTISIQPEPWADLGTGYTASVQRSGIRVLYGSFSSRAPFRDLSCEKTHFQVSVYVVNIVVHVLHGHRGLICRFLDVLFPK